MVKTKVTMRRKEERRVLRDAVGRSIGVAGLVALWLKVGAGGEEVERELDDDDEAQERRAKPIFDSTCWSWQMSGMLVAKWLSVLGREGWKW